MASSCLYGSASALLLFAILFNTHGGVTADVDPLLPVCKSVGGGSNYFTVEFCMSALGSDDRSHHTKDEVELSSIAVDLLTANATSTAAKIRGLIGGAGGNAAAKRCLSSCQALYGDVLQRQAGCAAAIKGGRLNEAMSSLEKSASAVKECENGFSKSSVASPLTAEDDNAFKLAELALALLNFPH